MRSFSFLADEHNYTARTGKLVPSFAIRLGYNCICLIGESAYSLYLYKRLEDIGKQWFLSYEILRISCSSRSMDLPGLGYHIKSCGTVSESFSWEMVILLNLASKAYILKC